MEALEFCQMLLEKALNPKDQAWWNSDSIKTLIPVIGTIGGAVVGYFAMRKQADKNFDAQVETALLARSTELDARLLESRLEKYEKAQEYIDQFTNCVSDYCASVKNWNDHNGKDAEKEVKVKEKIMDLEKQFYDGFLLLGSAESKILLLGQSDIHDVYLSLKSKAKHIYSDIKIDNISFSNEQINELKEDFENTRVVLFKKIGENVEDEHNKLLKRT